MANRQQSSRKSGQNGNKNAIKQKKSTKSKQPLNAELHELPAKIKMPGKLPKNSGQNRQQQPQQQREAKLTKLVQDGKRTEVSRSSVAKGQSRSLVAKSRCHIHHQPRPHLDQPQSSRCLARCGGGASSVTAANHKNHSKPSNSTNTKIGNTKIGNTKIGKRHSEMVVIKEAKTKVKPKAIVQTNTAANIMQDHRQKRDKTSNNQTKIFFDKYLKFAYDLTTPEGVSQLEEHFFPPSKEPKQNEQKKHLQQQPEQLQPAKMPKPQQLTNKPRNHTCSREDDAIEYILNQSKYFSYKSSN